MDSPISAPLATVDRPIAILLVDDHPALRAGLRSLLSAEPGISVIGGAASGEEAYTRYREFRPDVVIMDLFMQGYGGLEAIHHIRHFDGQARILVYSICATEVMVNRALAAGALGYVTKGSNTEFLVQGVREVGKGRGYVSPDLIDFMVHSHTSRDRPLLANLSHREFQVLLLTAHGKKPDACAQTLNVGEKTVRNHLSQIKAKLHVADTADLIRLAIRAGLVEP